jgi:hypothetical protein
MKIKNELNYENVEIDLEKDDTIGMFFKLKERSFELRVRGNEEDISIRIVQSEKSKLYGKTIYKANFDGIEVNTNTIYN